MALSKLDQRVSIMCYDEVEVIITPKIINESTTWSMMLEDRSEDEDIQIPRLEFKFLTSDVIEFFIKIINNIDRLNVKQNYVVPCARIPYKFLATCIQAADYLDMQNVLQGLIYVLKLETMKYHEVDDMYRAFVNDTTLRVGCDVAAAGGEAAGGDGHVCC